MLEMIDTYSRGDAFEAGDLVDVTDAARKAGITIPVALTRAVWLDCVEWTDADEARTGAYQEQSERLRDVVWMTRHGMLANRSSSVAEVTLYRVSRDGDGFDPLDVKLVAVIGPGDDAEPVVTVMTEAEWGDE